MGICGITKHAYYYKPCDGTNNKGRLPSEYTFQIGKDDVWKQVDNQQIIQEMVSIKEDPDTDYGYRAMTSALQLKGYVINHKKVYRLMEEYQLLKERAKKQARRYVRYRRVTPSAPLEVLEMDIKFQWVTRHQCYAFILTVLDCFTRKTLGWTVAYSIKQQQVKNLWESIIINYLQPNEMKNKQVQIEVRNDNDSRFAAKQVQLFFKENHLFQVFTHPYTPQENGHIESFHAILSRSLERKKFQTIYDLEEHLRHFYRVYNDVRLHGSLDHLSPTLFWSMWSKNLIESKLTTKNQLKHALKIPHYHLSGNGSLRAVSSSALQSGSSKKEVNGAITLHQPSV